MLLLTPDAGVVVVGTGVGGVDEKGAVAEEEVDVVVFRRPVNAGNPNTGRMLSL